MAAEPGDWVKVVNKLKGKLRDATSNGCQESAVRKVLQKLASVPMTLELLQLTHIGKEVNSLRKTEGELGRTAKQLVKSWKSLLAQASAGDSGEGGSGVRERHRERDGVEGGSGVRERHRERDGVEGGSGVRERHRERDGVEGGSGVRERHRERDGGEGGSGVRERHREKGGGEGRSGVRERDREKYGGEGRERDREKERQEQRKEKRQRETEEGSSSFLATPTTPLCHCSSLSPVSLESQRRSPLPQAAAPRKRKAAALTVSEESIAHSKRSRTQVYSGKKSSGPQVVMSLFDLSMKILMDNIDAIEEVGGVPYLILEPLLQKCSATQLLRLEEFNPHFLEDSDVLWKRHCERDFKGVRPCPGQAWRELYLSKLSDREERLRAITDSIKKKEEARKEPVRQVKLAAATRAPGRRRQASSIPLPSRSSLLNRAGTLRAPPSNASKLKKQTMKMIKERSLMSMSRPAKR